MAGHFVHVLHRLGRLKQRFEAERRAAGNNPLRLLKLRTVILKAERRLQQIAAGGLTVTRRLQPAVATAHHLRSRG